MLSSQKRAGVKPIDRANLRNAEFLASTVFEHAVLLTPEPLDLHHPRIASKVGEVPFCKCNAAVVCCAAAILLHFAP